METGKNEVILSIKNVSKAFPGVIALNDVSVEFHTGTVHGVVGENGAGKSTLMKILSGIYTKDSGTVILDGETIEQTTPIQSLKRGLSIIYQEFNLVNTLTVGENIYLGRYTEMKGLRNIHKKARELLDSIGSTIETGTLVGNLSAAEKQMVEITKALSYDSKLIIMDEPSSSLTADELKKLFEIIDDLRKKGVTIIYISHKLEEIFKLCDIVTIIRDGEIIDTKPIGELTRNDMITKMIGREIENEYPERPRTAGETIMEVQNIRTKKLKDIAFTLKKGEILGFVGLVGAGRTEIVRAIYGADRAKDFKIMINGEYPKIKKPRDGKRAGVGLLPEDRKLEGLVLPFSVQSNITMSSLEAISKLGFVNNAKEKDIAARQIANLSIKTPSPHTKTKTLSGGNQQKCIMGRWLEIDPDILILDEPTRGIDVGTKYEIYLLIKKIAENGGSVIMISSELPEVLAMSNRVLTICEGRITGEFNPEQTSAHDIMDAAIG
ncbi:MAG: sugar ABC transporter ATP-binding protein [Oscillospiraceae bacterium]|jgi:ribose transport system ATP-binding protein|nr:sugar ABC transporter ATP-binding protein [Oscillospiraceae bacterium]